MNTPRYSAETAAHLLDWAESLICNALPMSHCSQDDWDGLVKKWREAKNIPALPVTQEEAPIYIPPGWILTGNVPDPSPATHADALRALNALWRASVDRAEDPSGIVERATAAREAILGIKPSGPPSTIDFHPPGVKAQVIPANPDGSPIPRQSRAGWESIPEEVHKAAELVRCFFERQGVKTWVFNGVAGRGTITELEKQNDTLNKLLLDAQNDAHRYKKHWDLYRGFLLRAVDLLTLAQENYLQQSGYYAGAIAALLKEWEDC